MQNILEKYLQKQSPLFLDGGLATEMESRGADFNDPLWSAKILLDNNHILHEVYESYLLAGADIICSASYQATIAGFMKKNVSRTKAEYLIRQSVYIAKEARDAFWNNPENRKGRLKPLVAASIGPYGAFLADGSEYSGKYQISRPELKSFHQERLQLLLEAKPDVIAFETIPQSKEALVLSELLTRTTNLPAWMSLSCQYSEALVSGDSISQLLSLLDKNEQLSFVGVNCIAPEKVESILKNMQLSTRKSLVAYPNRGEAWDSRQKCWIKNEDSSHFVQYAEIWKSIGAELIGGCCRTSPADIAVLRKSLTSHPSH